MAGAVSQFRGTVTDVVGLTTFSQGIQLSNGMTNIPEPSTGLLTALAGLALAARRRR